MLSLPKNPALLLFPLLTLGACGPAPEGDASSRTASVEAEGPSIVGSWRLESWTTGNDEPRCSSEEGAAMGLIMYSADGHMSAQLGCAELDMNDVGDLTAAEAVGRTMRRHFSYYGRYTIDPEAQTVTHHVMGSVAANNWVGSDRTRAFVFETDDRIALSPLESEGRLVWLRN